MFTAVFVMNDIRAETADNRCIGKMIFGSDIFGQFFFAADDICERNIRKHLKNGSIGGDIFFFGKIHLGRMLFGDGLRFGCCHRRRCDLGFGCRLRCCLYFRHGMSGSLCCRLRIRRGICLNSRHRRGNRFLIVYLGTSRKDKYGKNHGHSKLSVHLFLLFHCLAVSGIISMPPAITDYNILREICQTEKDTDMCQVKSFVSQRQQYLSLDLFTGLKCAVHENFTHKQIFFQAGSDHGFNILLICGRKYGIMDADSGK